MPDKGIDFKNLIQSNAVKCVRATDFVAVSVEVAAIVDCSLKTYLSGNLLWIVFIVSHESRVPGCENNIVNCGFVLPKYRDSIKLKRNHV